MPFRQRFFITRIVSVTRRSFCFEITFFTGLIKNSVTPPASLISVFTAESATGEMLYVSLR